VFGPLVLRIAPPAATIATLAREAGFAIRSVRPESIQPVHIMELV
jgi:hypothetical protein